MSTFKFTHFTYPAAASPTPLHDGTNTPGQPPPTVAGFVVQPSGLVHLGGADVTSTTGLRVKPGETANITGFLSRGSYQNYELSQVYYVGGPFELIIEKEAKPS